MMQTKHLKIVGVATKGLMASLFSNISPNVEKEIYDAQQKD